MDNIVILLTAALGFGLSALLGDVIMPLLYRMRLVPKRGGGLASPLPERDTAGGGGAAIAAAMITASAAGNILIRLCSDEISPISGGMSITSAIQLIAVIACGAGFYSDILSASGKQGGIGRRGVIFAAVILSCAFLAVHYMLGEGTSVRLFSGESIDNGIMYYPAVLIIMTAAVLSSDETNCTDGLLASACGIYFGGAAMIFSASERSEYGILSAAAAGACMGFLIKGFPPAKCTAGRSGSLALGITAAMTAAATEDMLFVIISLVPIIVDGISSLILKAAGKIHPLSLYLANEKKIKKQYVLMIYFSSGAALAALQTALYYMSTRPR